VERLRNQQGRKNRSHSAVHFVSGWVVSPPSLDHFGIDTLEWTKAAHYWFKDWERQNNPSIPLDTGIILRAFQLSEAETQRPPYSMFVTKPDDFQALKRKLEKIRKQIVKAELGLREIELQQFAPSVERAHREVSQLTEYFDMKWGAESRGGVDWRARFVACICCRVFVCLIGPKFSMGTTQTEGQYEWETRNNIPTGDFAKFVESSLAASGLYAEWRGPTQYAISEFKKKSNFRIFFRMNTA